MDHCKHCIHFHNAGHPKNSTLKKYNSWCSWHGTTTKRAIGHCKQNNAKKIR